MPTENYRPLPIDFLILEKLPDKGMLGGVHWKGRRAADIRSEIIEELRSQMNGSGEFDPERDIPMSFFQGRLRSLHVAGYVVSHGGTASGTGHKGGGVQIWSRTQAGVDWLSRKEQVLS